MKHIYSLLFLIFILTTRVFSQGGVIILQGNYQGKNLYVQNPIGNAGVGFCVTEILVNGNITTDIVEQSAIEIDFVPHKLKIGDKVEVKIKHKADCKPKVVNPEVLKPKSTFEIVSMTLDKDGSLKWSTKSETGKLPFVIETFKWNKWQPVGTVEGVGTPAVNKYSFKITLHSGKNTVRVSQKDYSKQARLSKPVEVVSTIPDITFSPAKVSKEIKFVAGDEPMETAYEIYNQYGDIVKRGYGSTIDASNLAKGAYFLVYDNKMGDFIKK